MKLNDTYIVTIINLDHQGRGIAKISEKVIFIPGVLKDENVKIKVTNIKKNYVEGEVIDIITVNENRVDPVCPYFYACGGCDTMHMTYDDELKYKKDKIKNIISKYSGLNNVVKQIISSPEELYYRNKLTLQVDQKIGLYKRKTHDIIEIDKCFISDALINNCLKRIKLIKDLTNINQIIIRSSGKEVIVIIETLGLINEMPWLNLGKEDNIGVIIHSKNKYKLIVGNPNIDINLNGYKFKIHPSSFFQVNTKNTINLYDKIKSYIEYNSSVLDLYCGTGSIGLYISNKISKLVGIEINENSINDAIINKEINKIENATFFSGDSGKILAEINFYPDIVIVDPPRSGLDNKVISEIIKLNPKKIIYVSCDPITLARDLNLFKEMYNIEEITLADLFPKTHHVECVTLLSLKKKLN